MGLVRGDGAGSVRVADCAPVVGAGRVEMGGTAAAVRTGGGKVLACRDECRADHAGADGE